MASMVIPVVVVPSAQLFTPLHLAVMWVQPLPSVRWNWTPDTKGSGIPELTSLPELPLQPSALMHSSPPEALEGVHVHLAGCM